jgi:predicted nicotinamide N-methyase
MNFKTQDITLPIGHLNIHLTIIENLDELFDALIEKGDNHPDVQDERIPYWAELWASAIALSEYLVENRLVTEGVSVLEIGCGLGLPSIVSGLLGGDIILTDYIKEALDFARLNWEKNIFEKKPVLKILDWRKPDASLAADILLASDVAYEARSFEPLLHTFKTLLKPNGRIIVSEPNRYISKNFFNGLSTEGYQIKHTTKHIERKGHIFLVNIYELERY